jgi:hypothetical protein
MVKKWIEPFFIQYDFKNGQYTMSGLFKTCFENHLKNYFISHGIDPELMNGKFIISSNEPDISNPSNSKVSFYIGVLDCVYARGEVTWYSKTGLPIKRFFNDFALDDIKFVVITDNLEIVKKQLRVTSRTKININTQLLSYELIINHFYTDGVYLQLFFNKKDDKNNLMAYFINSIINEWNEESEKTNRQKGLIHFGGIHKIEDAYLEYVIDFGSAGLNGMKFILKKINELIFLHKVIVTSFPD